MDQGGWIGAPVVPDSSGTGMREMVTVTAAAVTAGRKVAVDHHERVRGFGPVALFKPGLARRLGGAFPASLARGTFGKCLACVTRLSNQPNRLILL